MQKLLVIVGPTAIGKTTTAIQLSPVLGTEIVSGDSMQVYREVAIGTAKPTATEQRACPHYLLDTRSIFEPYSVKTFVDDATRAISHIANKGKLPMLVGGTGLYVRALVNKLQLGEKELINSGTEPKWEALLSEVGPQRVWNRLAAVDPAAAAKIPVANSRRVLRALSVIDRTGQKFSEQQADIQPRYDYLIIGLASDRQLIYDRINARVDLMMEQGLLTEAQQVYDQRARTYQLKQAIGYKEFFPYFAGTSDLATCVARLKTASRRYAKRQLTYFKHQLPVTWFDPLTDADCQTKIIQKVEAWLHA
ncbi:MAG: tRNA (adenosine(37)-N6)-dimethylallyltransferase MiaA [Lactobacillus sp.]|nr:tRNA (adenosine(37)-N6)-dimethylallyltransferase MiaA [Lactobacillus sp.]MDN6052002.1 tRNA (adenosine(37)-N6)-dimethylallyltransferase MiaA [Lactobacillus sp.]